MSSHPRPAPTLPSLAQGRLLIVLGALLWSTSGAFTKLLTRDTFLHLDSPQVPGLAIAFYRVLFAGLVLVPTLRRRDLSFRRVMIAMVACFATMNALFVLAMAQGKAANAVLLQYTAPMWMYLASIWWLGEPADRRSSVALVIGLCGIGLIIGDGWQEAQLPVVLIALGSGLAYAGVILYLRVLREASSRWLTVLNHLGGAVALVPFLVLSLGARPSALQLVVLFIFGSLQMALPYWLVARGLRVVSPQEAGTITLLEPLLNPVWAYLVSPETEMPSALTFLGGGFILGALAWRYWPLGRDKNARQNGGQRT
jgi:drug/metabolite transporter (DMT)-like permease